MAEWVRSVLSMILTEYKILNPVLRIEKLRNWEFIYTEVKDINPKIKKFKTEGFLDPHPTRWNWTTTGIYPMLKTSSCDIPVKDMVKRICTKCPLPECVAAQNGLNNSFSYRSSKSPDASFSGFTESCSDWSDS